MTEAEHEAALLKHWMELADGADERLARRARIAMCAVIPFTQGVNREIGGLRSCADGDVLTDGAAVLAQMADFLASHMVVRGVSRHDSHHAVLGVISIAMTRLHAERERKGEVPMPLDEGGERFDFRTMLRGG